MTNQDHGTAKAFDEHAMRALRDDVQGGVIARWQLVELHAKPHDIRRLVRRRELTAIHPGVYVCHTGTPTWGQRAWAAVLACWPAALTGRSALPKPPEKAPIEVIVALDRTVRAPTGVVVRRHAHFADQVDWGAYPPRQSLVDAAIEEAARAKTLDEAFTLLAELVQRKHASARDLAAGVRRRKRLRHRGLLAEMLDDLAAGACSVLEREYLRRVERAHGLPRGERQLPDRAGRANVQRDVSYRSFGLEVELDGRAFHDTATARDTDAERDLDTFVEQGRRTVRLTYGQVFGRSCHTAARIGLLLQRGGWTGRIRRCPHCPKD